MLVLADRAKSWLMDGRSRHVLDFRDGITMVGDYHQLNGTVWSGDGWADGSPVMTGQAGRVTWQMSPAGSSAICQTASGATGARGAKIMRLSDLRGGILSLVKLAQPLMLSSSRPGSTLYCDLGWPCRWQLAPVFWHPRSARHSAPGNYSGCWCLRPSLAGSECRLCGALSVGPAGRLFRVTLRRN